MMQVGVIQCLLARACADSPELSELSQAIAGEIGVGGPQLQETQQQGAPSTGFQNRDQ